MREGARARAPREREGESRRGRLHADHEAAPDGDLGAEDAEEPREQLEGQGTREEDHVAVEMLAAREALRDVQDEPLLDQVRLEPAHAPGGERGDQAPGGHRSGQRIQLGPTARLGSLARRAAARARSAASDSSWVRLGGSILPHGIFPIRGRG